MRKIVCALFLRLSSNPSQLFEIDLIIIGCTIYERMSVDLYLFIADYFPNDGHSEYPYAVPTGRLSPKGKALRRRFEKVRLMSSAQTLRSALQAPPHASKPKPSQLAEKRQENSGRLSDRNSHSLKDNSSKKISFAASKETRDERKTRGRLENQSRKGRLESGERHKSDRNSHSLKSSFAKSKGSRDERKSRESNDARPQNHNHGLNDAHHHNDGHHEAHHQKHGLQEEHHYNQHNHGTEGGRWEFTNRNIIREMTKADNKNNNLLASKPKDVDGAEKDKKEAKQDGNGKTADNIETGFIGGTKETYGGKEKQKRLEDAKEIHYTSSFLSRRPLDYQTVGQVSDQNN